MKILLFGDDIGVPQLLKYLPRDSVAGVVAAAIRPQCIGELQKLADSLDLNFLIQPKWKSAEYASFVYDVRSLMPDLIWVNSYSMILREDVLATARLGGLNIHAALLPRNRGCNPTQWAILKGEYETGVTLHQVDNGIDTGPIIDQRRFPIFFEDTWLDVAQREYQAAGELLEENIPKIMSENWTAISQPQKYATTGRRRIPEDGLFHWSEPVIDIHNKIRALIPPLPGAFFRDKAGKTQKFETYQTVWQLTAQKFDPNIGCEGQGGMFAEHVRLRPLRKTDASLLYPCITDPEMFLHNSTFLPVSESDHETWVERMMEKQTNLVIFVVEERISGMAIGTCQLLNIDWINRSAELQIRIGDSKFLGRGYGSQAVNLLRQFGFSDLNLHRIYLHVFSTNLRAIKAYENCGFVHEGAFKEAAHIDGRWIDLKIMAFLNRN